MTMSSHINELQKKHETLAKQIDTELRSPAADDLEIAALKRQKLRLKDQIVRKSPSDV